jgi:hypothetical protein
MLIDEQGWAVQEHGWESVPACHHNAIRAMQLREEYRDLQQASRLRITVNGKLLQGGEGQSWNAARVELELFLQSFPIARHW